MSYKNDPIDSSKRIEMDDVRIIPYIGTIQKLRSIIRQQPIMEASVDADGMYESPSVDMQIPGAYIPLQSYGAIVKELHRQGYRLVRITPDEEE